MSIFTEHHEMFRAAVRAFVDGTCASTRSSAARDVRLFTIGGGTSEIMKEIIAKELDL